MNIKDPKDLLSLCNTIGFVCIILNIIIAIIHRNVHDVLGWVAAMFYLLSALSSSKEDNNGQHRVR